MLAEVSCLQARISQEDSPEKNPWPINNSLPQDMKTHKARHLIMSRLMSYLRAFAPISNLLSFLCEHNRKLVAPQRKALY